MRNEIGFVVSKQNFSGRTAIKRYYFSNSENDFKGCGSKIRDQRRPHGSVKYAEVRVFFCFSRKPFQGRSGSSDNVFVGSIEGGEIKKTFIDK